MAEDIVYFDLETQRTANDVGGWGNKHMMGISIAVIFCGCVVAFSWWGINLLGIGLHSYGFTAGLWTALGLFWGLEALVIGAGIARGVLDRAGAAASRA